MASANKKRALEIFLEHKGNITNRKIAELLGEKEKTISAWKSREKWNVVLQNQECSTTKKTVVLQDKNCSTTVKKRGAPKGSQNSKGHGAPKGNKNAVGNRGGPGGPYGNKKAVTTGEFETIWFDCLTEEEQRLYDKIDTDTLTQVEADIKFFTVRERRMMERIRRRMDGLTEKERKVLQELVQKKVAIPVTHEVTGETKVVTVNQPEMVITEITETDCRAIDDILKLEEALTRIQDKKTKAIALKHTIEVTGSIEVEKLQLSKARLLLDIEKAKGENKSNQHVDALRQKMAERKKRNGSS